MWRPPGEPRATGRDPGAGGDFSTPRGEERLVTVVFADLTESVRRAAALSPEQATDLVNPLLVALRRAGRVDEAASAAHAALELAIEIDNSYYQGHAHAVMSWVELMRGSGRCVETGERAYRAWGSHAADGYTGLGVEFAWLAVFPLAAETFARGEIETAARHLFNVLVPLGACPSRRPPPSGGAGGDE